VLTDIAITGYQSLRDLRIKLGGLTVVTGPTGSGKSGLIRAIRLAAFNASGTSYISEGAGTVRVMLNSADEGWAVRIDRSRARGSDAYELLVPGGAKARYTKLAGKVPDDVAAALRLSLLNFAGQFDPPYLLTESGGEVARRLGQLTNVTMIFSAAQEANRRRLRTEAELKATEVQVADMKAQAQRFRGIGDRRAAIDRAETALDTVLTTDHQAKRLRALTDQLRAAQAQSDAIALPPVASTLDELTATFEKHQLLRALLQEEAQCRVNLEICARETAAADQQHHAAEAALHKLLKDSGTCPVCGQAIAFA
jgi:DNA repair exonuclease SbcCD ATPase subunit